MTAFSADALQTQGYRYWSQSGLARLNHADGLWQKRIVDAQGQTLYFLDVWAYEPHHPGATTGWQPEWRGYLDTAHQRVVQMTLIGFTDIEEMEAWCAHAYNVLQCVPYEAHVSGEHATS